MDTHFDERFITFRCECGQRMKVPIARAGSKGRCRACDQRVVVPIPPPSSDSESVYQRRDLEGSFTEADLITYPDRSPAMEPAVALDESLEEKKTLLEMRWDILRYPVANKRAVQIFLTGAIIFSPFIWKAVGLVGYLSLVIGCLALLIQIFVMISVLGVWLMYFSYLLLIIEKSAEGNTRIPELPVFSSWQDNLKDLLKVIAVSAIAFSPFLVYSASLNIEIFGKLMEARALGEVPDTEFFTIASAGLGAQMLLYATASFYMPMVLLTLVVTKNFGKAVNPVFIFRSIACIWREYFAAMGIIFFFLRLTLTLLMVMRDLLAVDWLSSIVGNVAEPIATFYAVVVTMHIIGLLYHRNGNKLQW